MRIQNPVILDGVCFLRATAKSTVIIMGKTVTVEYTKGQDVDVYKDRKALDNMTEEELHEAALDDPDAQPLSEEQLNDLNGLIQISLKRKIKMGKKIIKYHVPGSPLLPQPSSNSIKFMCESEIHQRAVDDTENPPIKPKDFHKFKRVNNHPKR